MFRAPLLTRPPPFEAVGAPIMAPKAPSVPSHSFQNSFIKLKTAQATGSWRFDPSPKPPPPPRRTLAGRLCGLDLDPSSVTLSALAAAWLTRPHVSDAAASRATSRVLGRRTERHSTKLTRLHCSPYRVIRGRPRSTWSPERRFRFGLMNPKVVSSAAIDKPSVQSGPCRSARNLPPCLCSSSPRAPASTIRPPSNIAIVSNLRTMFSL